MKAFYVRSLLAVASVLTAWQGSAAGHNDEMHTYVGDFVPTTTEVNNCSGYFTPVTQTAKVFVIGPGRNLVMTFSNAEKVGPLHGLNLTGPLWNQRYPIGTLIEVGEPPDGY